MFVEKHPRSRFFRRELRHSLASFEDSARLRFWKDLVVKNRDEASLLGELRRELGYYDTETSIVLWENVGEMLVAVATYEGFALNVGPGQKDLAESIGKSTEIQV